MAPSGGLGCWLAILTEGTVPTVLSVAFGPGEAAAGGRRGGLGGRDSRRRNAAAQQAHGERRQRRGGRLGTLQGRQIAQLELIVRRSREAGPPERGQARLR